MKKHLTFLAALPLLPLPCDAAISVAIQTGELHTSASAVVSDTSLWAIVYDANNDNVLPGGLAPNASLNGANAAQAYAAFANKTITTGGSIGLDKILWAGAVNGVAIASVAGIGGHDFDNFTFNSLGVAANHKWAVYWFPGLTLSNNTPSGPSFEVGGIQEMVLGSGNIGMEFPASDTTGSSFNAAFYDPAHGGSVPQARLTAILAIPEPTPLIVSVSALSFVALLRRRRN